VTALADMSDAGLRVLDLLTTPEVALRLGCSPRKVRRLVADKALKEERFGTLVRFTPESVAAYEQRLAAGADTGAS
jgi:excisionase family DNA binding protein